MKMKRLKKALSLFLCMALCVAMALITTGCNDDAGDTAKAQTEAVKGSGMTEPEGKAETQTEAVKGSEMTEPERKAEGTSEHSKSGEPAEADSVTVLGEGARIFSFGVRDKEGKETWFEIHTDQETVGGALLELEMIEGEEGPFGLYVKSVNGITADYDKDKVYWAFYVNDAYAASGVDLTEIKEGDVYSFRMEK